MHCVQGEKVRKSGEGLVLVYILDSVDLSFSDGG